MLDVTTTTKAITAWRDQIQAVDASLSALYAITGGDYGSPLGESIASALRSYTVAVSYMIGDQDEWLAYYRFDCEFGKRPREVGAPERGIPMRALKTPRDVAKLIIELRP